MDFVRRYPSVSYSVYCMNIVRTKYTGVGWVLVTILYELILSSIDVCTLSLCTGKG